MRDPEQSSWARPWCGRPPGQWVWPVVSTSIASAARSALVRVFHRAVGVVGRVRSTPGHGAGAPLGRGRALSARARARAHVVDTDARCRHREGVVDIVRGLLTPRGGYNARWCQQRASVRTTRAHANNARRRPRPGPHPAVTGIRARSLVGSHRSPRPGPSSAQRSRRQGSSRQPRVAVGNRRQRRGRWSRGPTGTASPVGAPRRRAPPAPAVWPVRRW